MQAFKFQQNIALSHLQLQTLTHWHTALEISECLQTDIETDWCYTYKVTAAINNATPTIGHTTASKMMINLDLSEMHEQSNIINVNYRLKCKINLLQRCMDNGHVTKFGTSNRLHAWQTVKCKSFEEA